MSKESNKIVIMAGYPAVDAAKKDFDRLTQLVKTKKVRSDGLILVQHDKDGAVTVSQTGDHLGRKGMGWGAGAGVLVGLVAPTLLGPVVLGAAAGALLGELVKHKVESGIEDQLRDKLKPGTAAILALVAEDDRLAAEQALADSPARSVAVMDTKGLEGLKKALAEAGGKFDLDRSALPIPDRTFGGAAGRTLRDSVPDWMMIPGAKAPEGAPNVLLVLIDDAGFGGPDTFGGPIRTPNFTRVQQMGLTYNRFHVTAVCSPTRAALLTGRNQHRVGFGSIAEYPGPFPGYTAAKPKSCAAFPAHSQGQRLRHLRLRQVAPHARQRAGRGRPVRSLAEGVGLRPLVGLPVRRGRTVRSDHHPGRLDAGRARGQGRQAVLPARRHGRQGDRVAARGARAGRDQAVDDVLLDRLQPRARTTCRRNGPTSTRASSTRAGTSFASRRSRARRSSGSSPQNTELTARPDVFPAWDSPHRRAEEALRAAGRGVRRLLRERRLERGARARRGREDGRSRQHPRHLHLGRQRRQHGGDGHRLVQRDDDAERPRDRRRSAAQADRAVRRRRRAGRAAHRAALRGGLGARDEHAVPVGQADRQPPRRHARSDGRRLAEPDQGGRRSPPAVHARHRRRPDDPGGGRHPAAEDGGRDRPGADGRHQLPVLVRRREGGGAPHHAVLRDVRQPRHLQGRLVGGLAAQSHPVGRVAGDAQAVRTAIELGPGPGHRLGALQPGRRLLASQERGGAAPGQGQGAAGAVVERGRAQPRAAADGGHVGHVRDLAAAAHGHPVQLRGRRAEHPARHDPAHPGAVVRHRSRADGARRAAPRASSSPTPTSSAASRCGSTARACCTTRTRSWASRRTSRSRARSSRSATSP